MQGIRIRHESTRSVTLAQDTVAGIAVAANGTPATTGVPVGLTVTDGKSGETVTVVEKGFALAQCGVVAGVVAGAVVQAGTGGKMIAQAAGTKIGFVESAPSGADKPFGVYIDFLTAKILG